jgi:predicted nucleotidyltransferase
MGLGWKDCDPRLRTWVTETCTGLQAELGAEHVGTYLHGSLAAGSYYPPKSDVDLLFVVDGPLDVETRRKFSISAAQANRRRPITGSLECSVVRRSALAERLHPMPFEVHFGEEWTDAILTGRADFEVDRSDSDLVAHVQATCEFGVVLAGPEVADVFTAFPRSDFVDSIRGDLAWILEGENILESPFYGVLNVGRILWVLEEASPRLVPSKEEAGDWLLRTAPDRHRQVIELALDVYRESSPVTPGERRTGGRVWPSESLIAFRDWARRRVGAPEGGTS